MFPVAMATDTDTSILTDIASQNIIVSTNGSETIYSNIQEFYSIVRQEAPYITDIQLAEFILAYTGQLYDTLSDDDILEALDYLEISSTEQVLRVQEDGTVEALSVEDAEAIFNSPISPLAEWTSPDGYIKITTDANKLSKTEFGTPFILSATAKWLKFPDFRFTDTFAIIFRDATYDDSYAITASFEEKGSCSECGKTFHWNGLAQYAPFGSENDNKHSDLVELNFDKDNAINAYCDLKLVSCPHYGNTTNSPREYASTTFIKSTLRFKVLASKTTSAKAVYAHTKLSGKCTISVSLSGSGVTPSFSGVPALTAEKYSAAPVTLRCN